MTRRLAGLCVLFAAYAGFTNAVSGSAGTAAHARLTIATGWSRAPASLDSSGHFIAAAYSSSLSANGRFLAFISQPCSGGTCEQVVQVWLRDLSRHSTRHITDIPLSQHGGGGPAVSSDGHWVAVSSVASGRGGSVWLENLATRHIVSLPERSQGTGYRPSFSANGRYLVYRAAGCSRLALARYDLSRGHTQCATPTRRLGLEDLDQNDVHVSSDGRFAVFNTRTRVFRYDFTTHGLTSCTSGFYSAPSVDGAGNVLVGTDTHLYVCKPATGSRTQADVLPSGWSYAGDQYEPAMSGDGSIVAYRGSRPTAGVIPREELFTRTLPDGDPVVVADVGNQDASNKTVLFSENGKRLAYSDARGRIWLASR